MDGIFGSTNSLGGLLTEDIFNEGEADQFLEELGGTTCSKGFNDLNNAGSSSGNSSLGAITSSAAGFSTGMTDGLRNLTGPSLFASSLPLTSAPTQAWPQGQQQSTAQPQEQQPNGLALLSQLLGALQPQQPPAPQQQQPAPGLISQLAAAFKPSAPPPQSFTPVSQVMPSTTQSAQLPPQAPVLPSLNAQQQAALQTIISLGQLGNTSEGKKVRRMLSNRESARRSRHRKQAHVSALEERANKLEAENAGMQSALARAAKMEADTTQERARLYAELATLRSKVAQLEGGSTNAKAASKPTSAAKRGHSHNSSAANASEDSSCDSMPAPRPADDAAEPCCKRCRASEAV